MSTIRKMLRDCSVNMITKCRTYLFGHVFVIQYSFFNITFTQVLKKVKRYAYEDKTHQKLEVKTSEKSKMDDFGWVWFISRQDLTTHLIGWLILHLISDYCQKNKVVVLTNEGGNDFSSPEPNGLLRYCHYLTSVVVRKLNILIFKVHN